MIHPRPRTLTAAVIAALVLITLSAGIASAQMQIGPNEHFIGFVNGSRARPVVLTVCPGPARRGRMGAVVGGQSMLVAEVTHARGFTGPLSQVYAWFVPRRGEKTPTMLTFSTYGEPQDIPTTVRVPCGGRGRVEFSSCPYLAPCVYGWTPDVVRVRFGNIAV